VDTLAEDKNLVRLTNPGPDDELRQAVRGANCDDYQSPLFIAWQINSACNLGCLHCCQEAGRSLPDELTRKEALDLCTQIADLNVPYMAISGGEPLLCPYLFEVSKLLKSSDVSLKIETNGEFIDEQTAKRFADLKLRSIQISVDGVTAEAHETLRKAGNWEKAIAACKYLTKYGVILEVVFVPAKFNIHQVGDAVDQAYTLGAYGFYTGKTMRIGRAAKNWDILCPSEQEYEKFLEILKAKEAEYQGRMKIYYYPYDIIEELKYRLEYPSTSLMVLPNGKVKMAGPLPFICGDLRKESLKQVWQNYKKAWKNPEVIEFTKKVIDDPKLVAEANNWRQI